MITLSAYTRSCGRSSHQAQHAPHFSHGRNLKWVKNRSLFPITHLITDRVFLGSFYARYIRSQQDRRRMQCRAKWMLKTDFSTTLSCNFQSMTSFIDSINADSSTIRCMFPHCRELQLCVTTSFIKADSSSMNIDSR